MTEFFVSLLYTLYGLRSGTDIEQTNHSEQHGQKATALSIIEGDE